MKKRKQYILFIIAVGLLLLADFGHNVYSKKLADIEKGIDVYKEKYLDAELKNKELQEKIDISAKENDNLNDRLSDLHNDIGKLHDEKMNFTFSDRIGRQILQAIANNDTDKLNELTPYYINVFDNYFERTKDGITYKVPFHPIQSFGLNRDNVIISILHYYFDEDSKTFVITYHIMNDKNSTYVECNMNFRIITKNEPQFGLTRTSYELNDIEISDIMSYETDSE